jgi:integrase
MLKSGGIARRAARQRSATYRWRHERRAHALRSLVVAAKSLDWSPSLLRLLFDELYVTETLEELLGHSIEDLTQRQYPHAVAVALIRQQMTC